MSSSAFDDTLDALLTAMKWDKTQFEQFRMMIWVSTAAGAIVGNNVRALLGSMISPDPKVPPPATNPPLRRLSDYVILYWREACGGEDKCMKGLHYVIHQDVDNKVGQLVVEKVLGEDEEGEQVEPEPWSGKQVGVDGEEGKALVGCPNGYGIAFMLAQNQGVSGKKTIDSVVIFADKYGEMSLAYHMKDQQSA
ncbi:hypothetical protein MMC10_004005 [Thelotrema lepadinum]|nr:hypothetical protein [Thelotrema lepadinum]